MRKFYEKLQSEKILDNFTVQPKEQKKSDHESASDHEEDSEDQEQQENKSHVSEELSHEDHTQDDKEVDIADKEERVRTKKISNLVNENISKFYPIDKKDELENDFDSDELEEISEDEKNYEEEEFLMEDNRMYSQESAKNIHLQMAQMSEIYQRMSTSMESNLIAVQHYVRTL